MEQAELACWTPARTRLGTLMALALGRQQDSQHAPATSQDFQPILASPYFWGKKYREAWHFSTQCLDNRFLYSAGRKKKTDYGSYCPGCVAEGRPVKAWTGQLWSFLQLCVHCARMWAHGEHYHITTHGSRRMSGFDFLRLGCKHIRSSHRLCMSLVKFYQQGWRNWFLDNLHR